jgi:hypothetical protein
MYFFSGYVKELFDFIVLMLRLSSLATIFGGICTLGILRDTWGLPCPASRSRGNAPGNYENLKFETTARFLWGSPWGN